MPTSHPGYDESTRGMGLAGLLEVVRRRRALALLPFLFVITAAASLAFFLPSLWTARALILVNRPQIPETYVRTSVNSDLEARLLTLGQQVLGAARLQEIIAKHDLYPAERARRTPEEIVDKMRRDIQIKLQDDRDPRRPEPRTLVFSVAYRATDPVVAAEVTNTLTSLFIAENSRLREEQATGTSKFLETQLEDLRQKLVAQEQRITEYKERHLGELPEQREPNLRALERLQSQLQIANETSRRANERIQLISQSLREIDLTSGMSLAGAPAPADSAAARLALLRQELVALQTRYSDRYPDVVSTREQIRVLEEKLEADRAVAASVASGSGGAAGARDLRIVPSNPYIQSLMSQLDHAQVEAKTTTEEMGQLRRQIALYERRLENTPKREQELAVITRDYETMREMFRSLLAKRGEAEIAADLEQRQKGETFHVIEAAGYPDRPTGPNRLRLLLVGLALAIGTAAVAVVLAEQVDTSYRRVEEVRATAPMPVLSTIPRIPTEQDRTRRLRQQRLAGAAVALGLVVVASTTFVVARDNQTLVSLLIAEPASSRR